MELTDTHCHIHFDRFGKDNEQVYKSSLAAGISRMICVGTSLADSRQAIEFAATRYGLWAAAGVHPHEATEYLADQESQAELKSLLKQPKIVAVGEVGLDYYKSETPKLEQEKALRSQIEAAIGSGLPFIFHVRDAWADFWRIFDEYENLHGVVHSFSSGNKQLKAALSRGLYIGLNGIMTFTKDEAQLQAAKQVPKERLLLETDAPFLAPAQFRGQICEPKHVLATAEFLSELRGEPLEELAAYSTENATKLFGLK